MASNKNQGGSGKGRGGSRSSSRGRGTASSKGASAPPVTTSNSDCPICGKNLDTEELKCIECERCCRWHCTACAGMSDDVHAFMASNKTIHWFCAGCEEAALKAAQSDKLIEERCKEFLGKFENRIDDLEKKVDSKADKSEVDTLKAQNQFYENRIKGLISDMDKLKKTF